MRLRFQQSALFHKMYTHVSAQYSMHLQGLEKYSVKKIALVITLLMETDPTVISVMLNA